MERSKSWSDLGLRAVNLGSSFSRTELPRIHTRRVERVLVPDETGCVAQEIVTDQPDKLAA